MAVAVVAVAAAVAAVAAMEVLKVALWSGKLEYVGMKFGSVSSGCVRMCLAIFNHIQPHPTTSNHIQPHPTTSNHIEKDSFS